MQSTIEKTISRNRNRTSQASAEVGTGRDDRANGHKPWPLLLCGAGLVVISVAGVVQWNGMADRGGSASRASAQAPAATATGTTATGSEGLTIQGPGAITVLRMVYEPGQSSGWHAHRGIHAVAVLTGTVTVYEPDCTAHVYSPTDPYIGGQQLHLVRNEGDVPADMVVTYLNPEVAGAAASVPAQREPDCGVK
jgi:quercetin dioxygenase-like cupin family protein